MRAYRLATVVALLAASCGQDTHSRKWGPSSQGDALTVCPGATTVTGIDVSSYQGTIDWNQVAGAGYAFAIARINDGTYSDPDFSRNWGEIQRVGLIRGAYQFWEPNDDPNWQADVVINAVGQLGAGDLPVTLDVEWTSGTPTANNIQIWVDRVTQGTGKVPMIYTAVGYWNQYFNGEFSNLPLWVANYGVSCPSIPNSWSGFLFWQWGGGGVPGISGNVDQDIFNGSLADLQNFAGAVNANGCSASQVSACGNFGCACADAQCNGGYCPGTGCNATTTNNCAAFGCGCVDGQCNGGYCPGGGCTAKEQSDCAQFGCNCVDHQCNGGYCAGSGCTAKEITDCGNFGVNCVDHQCSGGYGTGSGCTAKEQTDCSTQGCGCVDHQCSGGQCAGTGCTARETLDCSNAGQDCAMGQCVAPDAGPATTGAGASGSTGAAGSTGSTASASSTGTSASSASSASSSAASGSSGQGSSSGSHAASSSGSGGTHGASGATGTSGGATSGAAGTTGSEPTASSSATASSTSGSAGLTPGGSTGSTNQKAPAKYAGCGCNTASADFVLLAPLALLARRRRRETGSSRSPAPRATRLSP